MDLFPPDTAGDPQGLPVIEGAIDRIVFENPETGFYVARLKQPGTEELTTVVGKVLAVSPGEHVRIWGEWIVDPKWGKQFKIERYNIIQPSTADGIRGFLGSGLIKGVGKKYAERIVDAFGVDTLRIIEEEPERLREVQGVGKKLAEKIQEGIATQKAVQSILVFLQGHGATIHQAIRIYKRYGDRAVAVIRDNPYRLAWEVTGFSFKTADAIAKESGIEDDAPERIEGGIVHVLRGAAGDGHTYLPKPGLFDRASELLGIEPEAMPDALAMASENESVVCRGDNVFLADLYNAEARVASRCHTIAHAEKKALKVEFDRAIAWLEKQQNLTLSDEQRNAIGHAVEDPIVIITGGPGTGKTTLIRSLIAVLEYKKHIVTLAAPTGKAARRMEEATGSHAQTIHKLLEFNPQRGGFMRNAMNPLECDVLIIDETSMVDVPLMADLLEAAPDAARVIIVGDVDQLPSVGPGATLLDMIASNTLTSVRLEFVFRQAQHSGIVTNAHRVNKGEFPEWNAEDVFFISRPEPADAADTIVEIVSERLPNKFDLNPVADIQVLSPMHRGEAGVAHLNERLQQALNPSGAPLPRRGLRAGDKVMQLRNNYDLDVYNGDTGILVRADDELSEAQVNFDNRSVLYSYDMLDDLALAYTATVHKAQGSEYPAVVIALLNQHYVLLQRNMLYTAMTRASKLLVIVGDERAVRRCVENVQFAKRRTALADRLRDAFSTA